MNDDQMLAHLEGQIGRDCRVCDFRIRSEEKRTTDEMSMRELLAMIIVSVAAIILSCYLQIQFASHTSFVITRWSFALIILNGLMMFAIILLFFYSFNMNFKRNSTISSLLVAFRGDVKGMALNLLVISVTVLNVTSTTQLAIQHSSSFFLMLGSNVSLALVVFVPTHVSLASAHTIELIKRRDRVTWSESESRDVSWSWARSKSHDFFAASFVSCSIASWVIISEMRRASFIVSCVSVMIYAFLFFYDKADVSTGETLGIKISSEFCIMILILFYNFQLQIEGYYFNCNYTCQEM